MDRFARCGVFGGEEEDIYVLSAGTVVSCTPFSGLRISRKRDVSVASVLRFSSAAERSSSRCLILSWRPLSADITAVTMAYQ